MGNNHSNKDRGEFPRRKAESLHRQQHRPPSYDNLGPQQGHGYAPYADDAGKVPWTGANNVLVDGVMLPHVPPLVDAMRGHSHYVSPNATSLVPPLVDEYRGHSHYITPAPYEMPSTVLPLGPPVRESYHVQAPPPVVHAPRPLGGPMMKPGVVPQYQPYTTPAPAITSYPTPAVTSYTSSYVAPLSLPTPAVTSYAAPSSYVTPLSLPTPTVTTYATPSSYVAPLSLPTPAVTSYAAPSSYVAPLSLPTPAVRSYAAPAQTFSSYVAPPVRPSYVAPAVSYITASPTSSYVPPVTSYTSSYVPPVTSYTSSYVPPVTSYAAPLVGSSSYSALAMPTATFGVLPTVTDTMVYPMGNERLRGDLPISRAGRDRVVEEHEISRDELMASGNLLEEPGVGRSRAYPAARNYDGPAARNYDEGGGGYELRYERPHYNDHREPIHAGNAEVIPRYGGDVPSDYYSQYRGNDVGGSGRFLGAV